MARLCFVPVLNVELSSFHNPLDPRGDYPRLKGKGAELKHLWPVMVKVWERHMRLHEDEDRLVLQMLKAQERAQALIDQYKHDLFFPEGAAREFLGCARDFLILYNRLARLADSRGDLLWSVVPKHHAYFHLAQRAFFCIRGVAVASSTKTSSDV